MIKVTTKGLDQKIKKLKELRNILNTSDGRNITKKLSEMAREAIYNRVKSGKGVSDDKQDAPGEVPLLALSSSYKKVRAGKLKFFTNTQTGNVFTIIPDSAPTLGEFGSPNKSNLTFTGQMLNAIKVTMTALGFKMSIDSNTRNDNDLTNKEVAAFASKARPFFALTAKEQIRLQRENINLIRQLVRKLFS